MARIEGKKAASDAVMEVAKLALAAAYRAPQITGAVNITTELVTDEVGEAYHDAFWDDFNR